MRKSSIVAGLFLVLSIVFGGMAFGGCIEGDCKNGTGRYQGSDGRVYEGTFVRGVIDGERYAEVSGWFGVYWSVSAGSVSRKRSFGKQRRQEI